MSDERVSGVGCRVSGKPPTTEIPTPDSRRPAAGEPNWTMLYAAVLGELTLLIIIFYAFTKAFS